MLKVGLANGECASMGSLSLWQLLNISPTEALRLIFHFISPPVALPFNFIPLAYYRHDIISFCFLFYMGRRLPSRLEGLCPDPNRAHNAVRKYSLTELGTQVGRLSLLFQTTNYFTIHLFVVIYIIYPQPLSSPLSQFNAYVCSL